MKDQQSAGVVLFRKDSTEKKFLLLNYPLGHWDFVKGKIESGETFNQTVIRETKEETGIDDLDFLEGFESDIKYDFQYEGEAIRKKVTFFLAETRTEKIKISDEHLGYVWVNYDEALKKITFQNAKNVLLEANNFLMKNF